MATRAAAGFDATELGIGILRIGTGVTLFLRHGWEKQPMHWAQYMAHFPDPIHIGSRPSFLIAFVADFVCAFLLALGLATRWVALFCFANLTVAWVLVHRFAFIGRGSAGEHGELVVLYLVALLALVFAGPGTPSIDHMRGQ